MAIVLEGLRVGEPVRCGRLAVFPLYGPQVDEIPYVLADEAIAAGNVLVKEVSEGGSVPDLLVENQSDQRVLFLEGEELVGAKQNRILNTSVLVGAHCELKIPVSCVEQHRWRYSSRGFSSSGRSSPARLRHKLKASVTRSARAGGGHHSDQLQVWDSVSQLQESHRVSSQTGAMSDVYAALDKQIQQFQQQLKYVDQATGMAVAIGEQVTCLDVFDKSNTCRQAWDRLLSGHIMQAMEEEQSEDARSAEAADVEQLLKSVADVEWRQCEAVGEGEEFRAESPTGSHASALLFSGTVVHSSVLTPA